MFSITIAILGTIAATISLANAVIQFIELRNELQEVRALCEQITRENKVRGDEEKQAGR